MPTDHHLPSILTREPFREQLLSQAAAELFSEPGGHYVDIGANVGSTAVEVATHSQYQPAMTLLEPSEFYFPYLEANTATYSEISLDNRYASVSTPVVAQYGHLHHWGGTAELRNSHKTVIPVDKQVNVWSLVSDNTRLVKIDIDGQDHLVCRDLIQNSSAQPVIYFENTIRSKKQYLDADALAELLLAAGYDLIVVARNCGTLLSWGSLQEIFRQTCATQMQLHLQGNQAAVPYTDVLIFPSHYEKTYENVVQTLVEIQREWIIDSATTKI